MRLGYCRSQKYTIRLAICQPRGDFWIDNGGLIASHELTAVSQAIVGIQPSLSNFR
jgi:hypothetical protein